MENDETDHRDLWCGVPNLLLIAASAIAMLAKRLRAPYTVALVAGGLMLSALRLPRLSPLDPGQRPDWLTPDVILIVFLPALVFAGSVKLNVCDLLRNSAPLLLLANLGVLLAALVTGCLAHWTIDLPTEVALLFEAIISATDPSRYWPSSKTCGWTSASH